MSRVLSLIVLTLLIAVIACAAPPTPALAPEESAGTCSVEIQVTPPPTRNEPAARPSTSDMVPRITMDELRQKIESGANILIVDNRHKEEYDVDHIKGAVSAPLAAIIAGEWTPPPDRELVLY